MPYWTGDTGPNQIDGNYSVLLNPAKLASKPTGAGVSVSVSISVSVSVSVSISVSVSVSISISIRVEHNRSSASSASFLPSFGVFYFLTMLDVGQVNLADGRTDGGGVGQLVF